MTHTTESLMERLRATLSWLPGTQIIIDTMQEAAAALEARDRRIAEQAEQLERKSEAIQKLWKERDALRAQLDALQSGDELPELTPIPFIQIEENLCQWAEAYARQAQAMAREKQAGQSGAVLFYSPKSAQLITERHHEGAINKVICSTARTEDFCNPLYTTPQPSPAQPVQVNAELVEALEHLQRQYAEHPDAFWDWSKARAALANAKAAQQKGQA